MSHPPLSFSSRLTSRLTSRRPASRLGLLLFVVAAAASSSARAQQHAPAHVTLEAEDPTVSLFRIDGMKAIPTGRRGSWGSAEDLTHVCRVPCGMMVDPNFNYRIGGPGMLLSDPIVFPDGGAVRLRVRPGSIARRIDGVLLTSLGVGLSASGGMLLAMSSLVGSTNERPPMSSPVYTRGGTQAMASTHEGGPDMMKTGGILLGVGAALLGAGIALWATSGTHVDRIHDVPGVAIGSGVRLTPGGLAF